MSELELAVIEWKEARLAFFAVPGISSDPKLRFPNEIWKRLGNAEHNLMKIADKLDNIS